MSTKKTTILRLRLSRLAEWWLVLTAEGKNLSVEQKAEALEKMVIFLWVAIFNPIKAKEIRARYKTCVGCFVFDLAMRRCRNGEHGCGCYVPFLVVASREPCYIRKRNPKFGWK